ncbi:MAG: hypothetical protein HQK83_17165, partial [Fibrobacteria bacterium]|nr:hypothetical protein [Fibrobacteria bacterium]
FISALREAKNFPLVGDTTFGKGIAQIYLATPGNGRIKVTNSLFQTRDKDIYHGKGLEPTHPATYENALMDAVELSQSLSEIPLSKRNKRALRKAVFISELNRREYIRRGVEPMIMERP